MSHFIVQIITKSACKDSGKGQKLAVSEIRKEIAKTQLFSEIN